MASNRRQFWAKSRRASEISKHVLLLHSLDVAACADRILARGPQGARERLAAVFSARAGMNRCIRWGDRERT